MSLVLLFPPPPGGFTFSSSLAPPLFFPKGAYFPGQSVKNPSHPTFFFPGPIPLGRSLPPWLVDPPAKKNPLGGKTGWCFLFSTFFFHQPPFLKGGSLPKDRLRGKGFGFFSQGGSLFLLGDVPPGTSGCWDNPFFFSPSLAFGTPPKFTSLPPRFPFKPHLSFEWCSFFLAYDLPKKETSFFFFFFLIFPGLSHGFMKKGKRSPPLFFNSSTSKRWLVHFL